VTEGAVFDVAVDLRRSSSRFGGWVGVELSAENKKQLWVPAGFGHAFLVLSESADFLYKTTDYYHPDSERSILWNDPDIGIQWPLPPGQEPRLSGKDSVASRLSNADVYD
jgi:dTDP-4-dehydrorhamnose 3,5-epimerase